MITATPGYLAANAKPNKLPVYVIQIQDYGRVFVTFPRTVRRRVVEIPNLPLLPFTVSGLPTWATAPPAPASGEKVLWVPITNSPTLYNSGNGSGTVAGTGTAITLIRNIEGGLVSGTPYADWAAPLVGTPSIPGGAAITKIYGVVRGSYDGIQGDSNLIGSGGNSFVSTFSAWSGVRYTRFAAGSESSFPWSSITLHMSLDGSLLWSGTSIFETTDIGFLIYYDSAPPPPTICPWIVEAGLQDLTVTVNDLDGAATLSDLVFSVQDKGGAITADFPGIVFEGKKMRLLSGFVGLDGTDYLTLFTGRVDSVEAANSNTEYMFTCPDVRNELSKVVYAVADDGRATDSSHPRTLNGHPLDILLALLEDEVGLYPTDIDVTKITAYRDSVFAGQQFEFRTTSPPVAADFVAAELMKPLGGYHRTNNLGQVTVEFYDPMDPTPVFAFTPANIFAIPGAGQAPLINQVSFRYDADNSDKFLAEKVTNDNKSIAKYGLFGQQIIEAKGVRSGLQGSTLAAFISWLIFLRYNDKQLMHGDSGKNSTSDPIDADWGSLCVESGDIVTLTHPKVPDRVTGTMGITDKTYVVMDKVMQFHLGHCQYKLIAVDISKFKEFLITGNSEGDYTAVSGTDQGKYLFQCGDDDKYSDGNPGNTLA